MNKISKVVASEIKYFKRSVKKIDDVRKTGAKNQIYHQ